MEEKAENDETNLLQCIIKKCNSAKKRTERMKSKIEQCVV